jgi:hypothetical protein
MSKDNMSNKERLELIVKRIQEVADQMGIHPSEVTTAKFFQHVEDVTPWQLRLAGGLAGIKKSHFPVVGKDLINMREQKETSRYIAELEKQIGENSLIEQRIIDAIEASLKDIKFTKYKIPKVKKDRKKKNMSLELQVGDIHLGKKTEDFDLEVAKQRMRDFVQVFLREYDDNQKIHNVERIILAILGDLIESFEMHGLESAIGCEFGTARQIQEVIDLLFLELIVPVAMTGQPIDIIGVSGNHDRSGLKKTMTDPGQNNWTWIIYNTLERLCKAQGLKNVTFNIPKGGYTILEIYGNVVLYEHGDNVSSLTRRGYEQLIQDRSKQIGKMIDMGRFGHFHEYACFGRGRIIFTESLCGQDSYAKIKGYNSTPGQTINYYVETKDRPNCFYRSFPVYLR